MSDNHCRLRDECIAPFTCSASLECQRQNLRIRRSITTHFERLPTSLTCNFRRDYNMLREADSDGGECD